MEWVDKTDYQTKGLTRPNKLLPEHVVARTRSCQNKQLRIQLTPQANPLSFRIPPASTPMGT